MGLEESALKRDFRKKLLLGLKKSDLSSKNMSLVERRNAIKLSSDVALAFARDGMIWSRALIANVSKQEKNHTLVRNILGEEFNRLTKPCHGLLMSKKIVRRSCQPRKIRKVAPKRKFAKDLAKKMIRKKTQMLKCIVPGGEFMDDECSLLDETLDYIISLKAQVDVMRRLANTVGRPMSNHE